MGLLDTLMSSVPSAPGVGFGPATAGGTSIPAAGGGAPPQCNAGGPAFTPPANTPSFNQGPSIGKAPPLAPAPPPSEDFFYPESRGHAYASVRALKRYGAWQQDGGPGARAAKAAAGLVIVPALAVVVCLENSVRAPL